MACTFVGLVMLAGSASLVVEEYACFSQLFDIKCQEGELIVFETARYGRNDTHVAYQCGVSSFSVFFSILELHALFKSNTDILVYYFDKQTIVPVDLYHILDILF